MPLKPDKPFGTYHPAPFEGAWYEQDLIGYDDQMQPIGFVDTAGFHRSPGNARTMTPIVSTQASITRTISKRLTTTVAVNASLSRDISLRLNAPLTVTSPTALNALFSVLNSLGLPKLP